MTEAERIFKRFTEGPTTSISAEAKKIGVKGQKDGVSRIIYHLPDGSTIITHGRGRNHRVYLNIEARKD